MPKAAIGIITYGESTAKYLPYFLDSLKAQTFQDFQLITFDNTEDNSTANSEIIAEKGIAAINLKEDKNVGFGKAYNLIIAKAIEIDAEYLLALNPDMIVEQDMLEKLVAALDSAPQAGAIAPKILRWDFNSKQKTDLVDSYGLTMDRYFRFFDAFQGQPDSNQIKDREDIFGFTGAAVLLRLKALEEIRFNHEYFDEFMFMYKEDCDLSLRIRLAGWKIMIEPSAVAFHDRTAANVGKSLSKIASGRRFKSPKVKQWSFLNQLILLCAATPL